MSITAKVSISNLEIQELCAKNSRSLPRQALSSALLPWYEKNKIKHPWREDWDTFKDPYRIWLSEIMLQQTTLKVVVPAYIKFVAALPNIEVFAQADSALIRSLAKGLGYYSRFHRMHEAARALLQNYKNLDQLQWPQTEKQWRELPGIGPYTAAALASICNQQRAAVVDGNVERVLCRVFDLRIPVNFPILKKEFKNYLDQVIPHFQPGDFNQALMELGQVICRPSRPLCEKCVLQYNCLAYTRNSQDLAPQAKLKQVKKQVELAVVIPKLKNRFLITRSGRGGRFLKKEPGFPLVHFENEFSQQKFNQYLKNIGNFKQIKEIGYFKHNITNHKILARCFQVEFDTLNVKKYDEKMCDFAEEHSEYKLITLKKIKTSLSTSLDQKAFRLIAIEN
ncbi:MAG: A/G-specific adenine glycosylase [Oligoflexales bacterium]|nr:A/G-specific adenine glycosylase [Oligoflexales bacterium]